MQLLIMDRDAKILQSLVAENNLQGIHKLIDNMPDEGMALLSGTNYEISSRDEDSRTGSATIPESDMPRKSLKLVHVAAFYDSLECLLFLHNRGFSLESLCAGDFRPIHYAALGGATEVTAFLCAQKVEFLNDVKFRFLRVKIS